MSNHKFEKDLHQEMGLMSSYRWEWEPRGVLFMLARYKFVAKLLQDYPSALEVGCGDGMGARLVQQAVKRLICIDIDPMMIASAKANQARWNIEFKCTDQFEKVDAIYSLDVIEHMTYKDSEVWLNRLAFHAPLVIIGSPSHESQQYASKLSRENHINCLSQPALKLLMKNYFKHVFMFSMNDEVISTGYAKMSHYNFALGIN